MKAIVYMRPDGGVSIIHPVINTSPVRENITEDEALERAKKSIPADASNIRVVDRSELPQDRTFRNAWTIELAVDMGKAREIHKRKLREARKPLLEKLDVEFMRALEAGADVSAIAVKKQTLRDVTADPAITLASTPDALKAVWPEVLKAG